MKPIKPFGRRFPIRLGRLFFFACWALPASRPADFASRRAPASLPFFPLPWPKFLFQSPRDASSVSLQRFAFQGIASPGFWAQRFKIGRPRRAWAGRRLALRPFLSLIRLRLAPLFFVQPGPGLRRPLNRRGPTQPALLFPSPAAPRIAAGEAQAPTIFPTKTNMCRRGRRAVVGSFFAAIRACARRRRRAGRTPLGPARLRAGLETQKKGKACEKR